MKIFFSLVALSSLFFFSCSSSDEKSDSPEPIFLKGQELEKDERFELALEKYKEVKNKFPYSQFATKSELAIADVYYKQESFAEAQVAYQNFRDLHPKHESIDYVIFRIGMSFYGQIPESIDRDQSLAADAINAFKELYEKFPDSKHAQESRDKKLELEKKLAAKEEYIAKFYMKKENWESALRRWEALLERFPNLGFEEAALAGAARCAFKFGDPQKAQKYFAELESRFPAADGLNKLRQELQ